MIDIKKIKLGIVVSRFNTEYTDILLEGAISTLNEKGLDKSQYKIVYVPGAFEIPMTAKKFADTGKYDAVIALGAVIRGETYHYELVCDHAAAGIQKVSIDTGVPVIFGIITTENDDQAIARTGGAHGNKGCDAALAALDMISLMKEEF